MENYKKKISQLLTEVLNVDEEKIYNMDTNGSRIIMPQTSTENIGDKKIEIRSGYSNYNLIISLLTLKPALLEIVALDTPVKSLIILEVSIVLILVLVTLSEIPILVLESSKT